MGKRYYDSNKNDYNIPVYNIESNREKINIYEEMITNLQKQY